MELRYIVARLETETALIRLELWHEEEQTVHGLETLQCKPKYIIITFKMNVLKTTSSSYVQNMIENMILTSYSDKSYVLRAYVASIRMMLCDKLKLQVSEQFLSHDKLT